MLIVMGSFNTVLISVTLLFQPCVVWLAMSSSSNFTDLSALIAFKSQVSSPDNILNRNWTATTSFCDWGGVSCSSRRQRVTSLILAGVGLGGTISAHIGNLSFLVRLDLSSNNFHGQLTHELHRLRRLKVLILDANQLEGPIPPTLYRCQSLQVLSLAENRFSGVIPNELGYLPRLRTLYLGRNNLVPPIPSSLSNISTLQYLSLAGMGLTGSIPSVIFNMSSLLYLFLPRNNIASIPRDFCLYFPGLEKLDLAFNRFTGPFPSNTISQCTELRELIVPHNRFDGSIPEQLSSMPKLTTLFLGNNSFTGRIPPSLANISGLEQLWLGLNSIQGNIPVELALLSNLNGLLLEGNLLTGDIPPQIFNMTSLQIINLSFNSLSGILPSDDAFQLPNLERFYMSGNQIGGSIPQFLSNSSKLFVIDFGYNSLTGPVPTSLGNLRLLQFFHINNNLLTGGQEGLELDFITALTNSKFLERLILEYNPLNGVLPDSVGNLSSSLQTIAASGCLIKGSIPSAVGSLRNLKQLQLSDNEIAGTIPPTIGALDKLQRLYLDGNKIEGFIPDELCRLQYLGELSLQGNKLSGSIPNCIGNLQNLQQLHLGSNTLTSPVPTSLWGLHNLLFLNLSFNSLDGRLPPDMKMTDVMVNMDISWNQLAGDIPRIIGSFKILNSLNLSGNSLQGPIPESLGHAVALEFIDFSHNNLSGIIPKSLEALTSLKYLNFSYNKLSGEIPTGGPFANFTAGSFRDNEALCGQPIFQVLPCRSHGTGKSRTKKILLYCIIPGFVVLLVFSALIFVVKKRQGSKMEIQNSVDLMPAVEPRMISYWELRRATDNFCETNLLGVGSFASVYKGVLADGEIIAVKVLNLQMEGAFKSFDAECKVLRTVRHRNLVKVISTCSNDDLRALVLQYLSNGSLEKWLYSHSYCLDLLQRVSIMIDVALGLEYLHHGQSEPVVHCDLKPSNVLLDDEMVAHIGDFGIARILANNKTSTNTKTLGTLGYIAPEYGSEGRVSTSGDIYSFGILLLETFTRKKPTDEMFGEELSLRQWVSASIPENIVEAADGSLLRTDGGKDTQAAQNHILAIMELGLECCEEVPEKRSVIKDVVVKLNKIKLQLLQQDDTA